MADIDSDRARSVGIDMRGFRAQPNNDRISMRKRSKNRAEIHGRIHQKSIRKSPRKCQENSTEKHHKNHQKTIKNHQKHKKTRLKKDTPKDLPGLTTYGGIAFSRDPLLPQTPSSQRCLTAPKNGNAHKRFP